MPESCVWMRPVRTLAWTCVLAFALAACCPAPTGSAEAPAAFSATVTDVDATGFWTVARDGSRWRVAGAAPVPRGERVYLEGVWMPSGAFRVERVTRLPDS